MSLQQGESTGYFTEIVPLNDHSLWTGGFFNERFPQPVSPLGWSLIKELVEEFAFKEPLRFVGYNRFDDLKISRLYLGHPFVNVRVFQMLYKHFPEVFLPADAHRFFPGGRTEMRKEVDLPKQSHFFAAAVRTFVTNPHWHPLHFLSWERFVREYDKQVSEVIAKIDEQGTIDSLLESVDYLTSLSGKLLRIHRWSLTYAETLYALLRRLVKLWLRCDNVAEVCADLVSGLSNKTTEVDGKIWELTDQARRLGSVDAVHLYLETSKPSLIALQGKPGYAGGMELRQRFKRFLEQYGHRSVSLDIFHPGYSDNPRQVVQLIEDLVRTGDAVSPVVLVEKQAEKRDQAVRKLKENLSTPIFDKVLPVRWWVMAMVLKFSHIYLKLREDQRFYWQKSLFGKRRAFLRIGEILARDGVLEFQDDIFFLTQMEIRQYARGQSSDGTLRKSAEARRREFSRIKQMFYPPFLEGNTPLMKGQELTSEAGETVMEGIPASPGIAQGKARITVDPACLDEAFQTISQGDILVTLSTDPAWTPIFPKLGGLVMETGGQLSHGAVVAREYGIPAVVGIAGVTRRISRGKSILVDGYHGIVSLLE